MFVQLQSADFLITLIRFDKSFQSKMIRRGKTQKGPANHPVPNIVIKTSSPINPLLNLFREMGVAEDDDLKPFQKLLMGKGLEGWRRSVLIIMIFLITHIAQLSGDPPGNPGPR